MGYDLNVITGNLDLVGLTTASGFLTESEADALYIRLDGSNEPTDLINFPFGLQSDDQIFIQIATGQSPLVVASTTKVNNLNADLLDDKNTGNSGNTIPLLDGTNTWSGLQTFGNFISFGGSTLNVTSLTTNDILKYNGTNWINVPIPSGSGAVNDVSNIDGTLTISPTTGSVVASINLTHANTWTGIQTFDAGARLNDNDKIELGDAQDAAIYYDATNLIIDPKVVGTGVIDTNGGDVKANQLGLAGSAVGSTAVITASFTSSTITRGMLFSPTYNGTGATLNPLSITGSYAGSNSAPNSSSNITLNLNANPSGNALIRGVNASAGFSTAQTNAGQKTVISGYFATTTSGTHTTGTINTVNLYAASQLNVAGTATEVSASAWLNGDVVIASTGKLYLESSISSEGLVGMTFTKGDTYIGFDSTTANKIQFAIDNTVTLDIRASTVNMAEAIDFVLGTTTGTKFGTATTQKLGFFNATPIVQVGATIDLGVVLSNLGLRAAGTAYTITTSGAVTLGSLTAGRVPFAGTAGLLSDDADFTFATDTLTITKIAATTFTGNVTLSTINIVTDTTTGTKIGTATTQKLGFWNATPVVRPSAYTPTNVSTDRSYDANSTTVDEIADVLGTLIADLQSIGLIG